MAAFTSFFSREPAPLLGVDISASSLKLVELKRSPPNRWELLACASLPIEPGWVKDGNLEQFDEVAAALRQLVKKSGSKTRHVALALPTAAVITKKITLPANLSEDEFEFQVESEAAQYLPFPLADVSLDFCVLGPASNNAELCEVMLAATRKERVSDRQGLAEAAGLEAVVLDVESFASRLAAARVIEALPNRGHNQLIALFEVGSQHTFLQVVRNDELLYERDQTFGGAQLTALIARHYGLSVEEAETKKRAANLPPDFTTSVLAPYLEQLAQDIGRALQFFFTSTPYNKVDHVLISGGGAAPGGLEVAVMNLTSFPCKVINPFEGMALQPALARQLPGLNGTSFLVATGLAMRRYSL